MPTAFAPLKNSDRLISMDALRGLALLGIFIANIPGFNFLSEPVGTGPYFTSLDNNVRFLDHMLLEGKFYSIFSFLFGWGIALQIQRREENQLKAISFARRRLFFMLVLGLSHIVFLWIGDIVAFYAMLGFVLLAIRKWKDRTLFITAILLILSPVLLYYIKMIWPPASAPQQLLNDTGIWVDSRLNNINSLEEWKLFLANMNYFDLIKTNIAGFFWRFSDLFFQSRISKVLGMFILGFLMGRKGRYKTILKNYRLLSIIALAGLLVGLPANYMMSNMVMKDQGEYYGLKLMGWHRTIAYAIGVAPQALAYMALFFLLAASGIGKFVVKVLAPVGKMAFTNYILQSLVATIFFLPFGLNMMGKLGAAYGALLATSVFLFQIIVSRIWLNYFQYGPVEWLWRSATYKKWQSFTKRKQEEKTENHPVVTY
jgi:uncharacterized protein